MAFDGQEDHADAVFTGGRESEAEFGGFALKESVGDLDGEASAVTGFRVAAASATVGQIDEDLNALEDDVVGLFALEVDDEAEAAGIALLGGRLEALGLG